MRLIQTLILALLIACQRIPSKPGYPVTPQVAVESTFKIEQWLNGRFSSSGTAWIVDTSETKTYLMTAGHVCDPDGPGFTTFKIASRDDEEYWAKVLAWHSIAEVESGKSDLCLLEAEGELGRPMLLAEDLPAYGAPIMYVGAPMGMWGSGLAPIFDGRYMGARHVSAPTMGGASGSAMFTREGVFGVLVMVDRRFHHMVWFVKVQDIRDFLYSNGLKKFTPSKSLLEEIKNEANKQPVQTPEVTF